MATKKKSNDHVEAVVEHIEPEAPIDPCSDCTDCLDCEPIEAEPNPGLTDLITTKLYIVQDGDTYASIAANNCPAGMKKFEYATHLVQKNGAVTLNPGTPIKL